MKNKKLSKVIAATSLTALIAVGGTLALLSATTGTLKNTFTAVSDDAIDLAISEKATDSSNRNGFDIVGEDGNLVESAEVDHLKEGEDGINYTNILPGAEVNKEVTVNVPYNAITDSYVFLKLTGVPAATDAYTIDLSSDWTLVDGYTDLYVYQNYTAVNGTETAEKDLPVFTTVTVKDVDSVSVNDITAQAVAVQSVNASSEDALAVAVDKLAPTAAASSNSGE